jgi:hypothetical protein
MRTDFRTDLLTLLADRQYLHPMFNSSHRLTTWTTPRANDQGYPQQGITSTFAERPAHNAMRVARRTAGVN